MTDRRLPTKYGGIHQQWLGQMGGKACQGTLSWKAIEAFQSQYLCLQYQLAGLEYALLSRQAETVKCVQSIGSVKTLYAQSLAFSFSVLK